MPRTERRAPALALALLLLFLAGWAQAAPRIGVATMEPGEVFWERFGHNALVVVPADGGPATSYNFGYFDLDEPGFVVNFIRGHMRYHLVALPLEDDLWQYRQGGRGVAIQWLRLPPEQAEALAADLALNARPENARYTYDYYTSNCSTRVRDALDRALGGTLRAQLSGRSQGNSYRSESVRLAAPAAWMALGFHLGLSRVADRPLSRWDEAFIPMRLRDSLREVKLADGQPLVESEVPVLPHGLVPPPDEMPRLRGPALVAGLVLAIAVFWAGRRQPRKLAVAAGAFWLVSGLLGLVMAFIWLATVHRFGHGNQNLLLLNPLCLGLLPGAWALARGRQPSRRFHALLVVVAAGAALAGFIKFLPFLEQQNTEWVLLLLPLHWALLKSVIMRR